MWPKTSNSIEKIIIYKNKIENTLSTMKKIILSLLIIATIMLVGCQEKEIPFEEQHPDTPMINIDPEHTDEVALKCNIGNIYYLKKKFIYHYTDNKEDFILSPVGSYTQPFNKTNWELRMYSNRQDSLYNQTLSWMLNQKMPNGAELNCVETYDIPREFERFIGSHYKLFSKDNPTQLNGTKWI